MDFEKIDELNEEDMNALYSDIVEFGDETNLAGCLCASGRKGGNWNSLRSCTSWCRSLGSTCSLWDSYCMACYDRAFSC